MELHHFIHRKHPLVFNEDERRGVDCYGCLEPVFGPSYSCIICKGFYHHKSCANLPLELQHPLHPKHPLILFDEKKHYDDEEYSKCNVCKVVRGEYTYGCSQCDFNLHNRCASLGISRAVELPTIEVEVHNHQLIRIWKPMNFTCDLCGKEGNVPIICPPCNFVIHASCAICPRQIRVIRHDHPLDLIYSLKVDLSNIQYCQLCAKNVDTHYGFYNCSKCNFFTHLDCAMAPYNRKFILKAKYIMENEDLQFDQSVDLATYKVKKTNVGKDGIKIATEIEHFSHKHELKFSDEVQINKICNGCIRAIQPPFYNCADCSFFLHKSCVELPRKKRHSLHPNPLTLITNTTDTKCNACGQDSSGFFYSCEECNGFDLDVHCSLMSYILTHQSHEHRLILCATYYEQSCSNCDSKSHYAFRCTTCEFSLDFKCATFPQTTWYNRHEHPFTLCYTAEDDSGEYYCDICEEERDPKAWFYYCADCSYPAHPECILGE